MIDIYEQYRRILGKELSKEEIDAMRINVKKIADILIELSLQLKQNHEDKR